MLILVNVFFNARTQEVTGGDLEFKWNYGNSGGGMNVFSDENNFELSASLMNFFIEHNKTNIGLEVTPLKYTANYSPNTQKWDQYLYFLNGNLYWNPFDIKNIILGPFVSINYLSVKNWEGFNTDEYVFGSGLKFLLRTYINEGKHPFHIVESEIGYRNVSGRHGFCFNVNFDLTLLAAFIIGIMQAEASDVAEANEDYERQISGTGPFVPKEPKQPKPPFQDDREIR